MNKPIKRKLELAYQKFISDYLPTKSINRLTCTRCTLPLENSKFNGHVCYLSVGKLGRFCVKCSLRGNQTSKNTCTEKDFEVFLNSINKPKAPLEVLYQ